MPALSVENDLFGLGTDDLFRFFEGVQSYGAAPLQLDSGRSLFGDHDMASWVATSAAQVHQHLMHGTELCFAVRSQSVQFRQELINNEKAETSPVLMISNP